MKNFRLAALALSSAIAGLVFLAPCRDFQNDTHFGTARMTATSDRQDQTTTDCDNHTITDGRIVETTASLGCLGRAFAQVHQVDQAWLPSLMHSFVGHGSVREPYPPALKRQFTRRGRHVPACTHARMHTHARTHTHTHTLTHTHTRTPRWRQGG